MSKYRYIIYRSKSDNKILSYSKFHFPVEDIEVRIKGFNERHDSDKLAEFVISDDIISMIEMIENEKFIKHQELRDIEDSLERVQQEIYLLNERVKNEPR